MKLLLSPAKSLDLDSELPTDSHSKNVFMDEAKMLNSKLKPLSVKDLKSLMRISDNLAQLNFDRNQEWETPFTSDNARPAIYTFNGDAFRSFDAYTVPSDKEDKMQDTVRILSGLYGVLKPLDLIQPYRLEMKTKLENEAGDNLYDLWQPKIAAQLNKELKKDEVILNLASNEYFKAVDTDALKAPIITANFKDLKNGEYKVIMTYAKQARGLMARYVIDKNIDTLNDLKGFDYEGYAYSEDMSSENELVFTR